jgi:hypothetical protein
LIPEHRREFNRRFTPEKYASFLRKLDEACGGPVKFRNSETPVFLPRDQLLVPLVRYAEDLILQLMEPDYLARSEKAVPDRFRVPNEDAKPLFIQVDFGLDRNLEPKLVEIQAFPSLYAYQPVLQRIYKEAYDLPHRLDPAYVDLFRQAVLGDHQPEHVVLMDIHPEEQKTRCDFALTEKLLGIKTVCITEVEKRGRKLYHSGRPIERIYNRAIVDELLRKNVALPFDYRDELDVEWAGHPNWYYRISKFSIPFLKHSCVPGTKFLSEGVPEDLENWVLKPLYSFAGLGVVIGPKRAEIDAIKNPDEWIIQEKVDFAPLIETPHGLAKFEIRVMYIWLDELLPVSSIIRMGRGKMMGVDHNRDMEWVGASAAFVVD